MSAFRRWSKRLVPRRREVVLAAEIEYDTRAEGQKGMKLRSSDVKSNDLPLPKLRHQVEEVLARELPSDLEKIFGLEAEVEIRGHRYGSLHVFFGVVLAGLSFVASYKDFYDSIQLIRDHARLLLRRLLEERYPHHRFDVKVDLKRPHRLPDPYDLWSRPGRLRKMFGPELEMLTSLDEPSRTFPRPRRDGFFWFLVVLCIVLLAALGVLVYAAVIQTYFPPAT